MCRASVFSIRPVYFVISDLHAQNMLLECETTVRKLIQILNTNTFESGDHIDFFDVSFKDEQEAAKDGEVANI